MSLGNSLGLELLRDSWDSYLASFSASRNPVHLQVNAGTATALFMASLFR